MVNVKINILRCTVSKISKNHPCHSLLCSRLVTLLKVIDAPVQVSDILGHTVSSYFINFSFQIFLLLLLLLVSLSFTFLHCLDYLHCFGLDPVAIAF